MALQANTGRIIVAQNLVLLVDISSSPNGEGIYSYLAEIYEETEGFFKAFPSLPVTCHPLLHSSGNRQREFASTLALIDVLLGTDHKKGYRATLESWLFSCQALPIRSHQICFKVRHQGILQDPSEPKSRTANFNIESTPTMVPSAAITEAARVIQQFTELRCIK